jgi:hypothetical protein
MSSFCTICNVSGNLLYASPLFLFRLNDYDTYFFLPRLYFLAVLIDELPKDWIKHRLLFWFDIQPKFSNDFSDLRGLRLQTFFYIELFPVKYSQAMH